MPELTILWITYKMEGGKMENYCKRCLEESEFGGFNYFPSFGLSVEINLCEICMEEFRELLERFFKEVQIIKANY